MSAASSSWFTQFTEFESHQVPGLLGLWASTEYDLSTSIKRKPPHSLLQLFPSLKASLPVHSFCSYVFAFAPQHPALNSDLTIPTNLSLCYISKRIAPCTQFSQSRALERRPAIITRDDRLFCSGSANLAYPTDIAFLRAKPPLYHRRRCIRILLCLQCTLLVRR